MGSRIPSKFQLEGQMDKACKPPVDLDLLPNHWVMSFLCRTLCSEKILYTEFCIRKLRRLIYFNKIKIILTHPADPGLNPRSVKIFLKKIIFTAYLVLGNGIPKCSALKCGPKYNKELLYPKPKPGGRHSTEVAFVLPTQPSRV